MPVVRWVLLFSNTAPMAKDPNKDIIDAFSKALENPKYKLTDADQIRLDRLKAIFTRWKSNPLITETQMRDYIITQFGIGRVQAYRDMATVKLLFGSAPKAEKEFQRMRANRLLEAAQAAALAGDDKQAKSLTKIAEVIVKTNQLDQPDGEDYPWEEIVPRDESFSVDPETIGIAKVPNIEEKVKKLLAQYTSEIDDVDIQDAQ